MRSARLTIWVLICSLAYSSGYTQQSLPTVYSNSVKVNYIRTWAATAPEQNPATLVTRPLKDVKQITAYFDGLGRPLQTVVKQGSLTTGSSPVDLVSPVVYDAFGREKFKYLPFAANNAGNNTYISDGLFKLNPFQQQLQFYNTQLTGQAGETNVGPNSLNWAYSQTTFEVSPLSRVQESFAAGSSWVGTAGESNENNRRSAKIKYHINTPDDDVKIWTVTDVANNWGTYAVTGIYPAGQLYKNITIDEHGKQVIEFNDKEGQVLLKKVQLTATTDNGSGSGHTGWLCTYYVYDDRNNLRLVIQPRGVELLLDNSWNTTWDNSVILNEQCFRYEYDARRRLIRKKVPGAAEVWMVYDQWDRLVLTQDGNQRAVNEWLFTKYDALNRVVYSGKYTNASYTSQSAMQGYLNTQNMGRYETYSPGTTLPMYSLSQSFPVVTYSNILSITYYDDYAWTNGVPSVFRTFDNSFSSYFANPSTTTWPYPEAVIPTADNTRGLVTGTVVKALDGSTAFATTLFYDEKGRVIQTKAENYSWGCDITTTQYNFSGQPLTIVTRHEKVQGSNPQTHTIVDRLDYDDLGRLLATKKTISSIVGNQTINKPEQVIATREYDALGQLKKKTLAPTTGPGGGPLETLTYDYNIRGWMLGMNRAYAKDANSSTNRFGFDLAYDKNALSVNGLAANYTDALFNGNITGMLWKSGGDNQVRRYDFTYDAVNRLTSAAFKQFTGNDFNLNAGIDFSVSNLSYDANGNILRMDQKGWKPGGSVTIDNLFYKYEKDGRSNRLQNVIDNANDQQTKLGDFRTSSLHPNAGSKNSNTVDYTYDPNGNLKKDLNKDIGTAAAEDIVYNYLNLPQTITMRTTGGAVKGTIYYTYDANGVKHRKRVQETGKPDKVTLYMAGFVYEDDILQFLGHEEGRTRYAQNAAGNYGFIHDYFLKDHLGNVRMVLTEEQQQDAYPAATLEGNRTAGALSMINYEKQFYRIEDSYITSTANVPGWQSTKDYPNNNGNPPPNTSYPPDHTVNSTAISQYMYRLNATSNKTGLGIVLKVMAGDKIDIHGKSYYQSTQSSYNNSNSTTLILTDLIGAFIGAPDKAGFGLKGITAGTMETINTGVIPATFFRGNNGESVNVPKAYINFIFFDEQFKYAGGGASRVGASGSVKSHWFVDPQLQNIGVPKNGYIYVYVSNESNESVFFDNLQVFHTRGPILEETHYYPFGLTMAGISSKAAGKLESRYKFNDGTELANKEFSDGSGLELYETDFRGYDPQIGRFHQTDPLADIYEGWTPYAFANNNPILLNDPLGLSGDSSKPRKKTQTLPTVTVTPKPSPQRTDVQGTTRPITPAPSPSTAGLPATPLLPGLVVVNSGRVVQMEVGTIAGPSQAPSLGFLRPLGLTLAGIFYSNPAYAPTLDPPFAGPRPDVIQYPYPGHGNNRGNWDPHIVYEFIFEPKDGLTPVIKYGISDLTKNGMDRPQDQLAGLKARFGNTVTWRIYTRTMNRGYALFVEKLLVTQHVNKWNEMPRDQFYPKPFPYNEFLKLLGK